MIVVQVSEVRLVGRIGSTSFYAPVISSPFAAEPLPLLPGRLNRIVPVSGAEHLPQVVRDIALVSVAHVADDIALQMGGAALELRSGEHLADHIFKTLQAIGAYKAYLSYSSLYTSLSISPQPCALSVGLL